MSELIVQGKGPTGPTALKVDSAGALYTNIQDGGAGFVSLASPPGQTNAAADTPVSWSQQVTHYRIQNNTNANLMIREDAVASAGSFLLVPGATYREDKAVTTLHLYTQTAQAINGASAGNIVVEGWN